MKEHIVDGSPEMKPKKLKIKWGKRYVTRNGTVVVCTAVGSPTYFGCYDAMGGMYVYTKSDLRYDGSDRKYDIVAAYKKPSKRPAPAVDTPTEAFAPEEPGYPALYMRRTDGMVAVFHTVHRWQAVRLPHGAQLSQLSRGIYPCTNTSVWKRITPEKLYELLNEDIKNGRN